MIITSSRPAINTLITRIPILLVLVGQPARTLRKLNAIWLLKKIGPGCVLRRSKDHNRVHLVAHGRWKTDLFTQICITFCRRGLNGRSTQLGNIRKRTFISASIYKLDVKDPNPIIRRWEMKRVRSASPPSNCIMAGLFFLSRIKR